MQDWITSGRVVDWLLLLVAVEAGALLAYHCWTARGVPPRAVMLNLLSGACLLGAMRAALGGAWWPWVSMLLAMAGLLHALDLRRLWR